MLSLLCEYTLLSLAYYLCLYTLCLYSLPLPLSLSHIHTHILCLPLHRISTILYKSVTFINFVSFCFLHKCHSQVQESAASQYSRLEDLKSKLEALNPETVGQITHGSQTSQRLPNPIDHQSQKVSTELGLFQEYQSLL